MHTKVNENATNIAPHLDRTPSQNPLSTDKELRKCREEERQRKEKRKRKRKPKGKPKRKHAKTVQKWKKLVKIRAKPDPKTRQITPSKK